jgi:assimilatory nitrate reductase catalytic subunit
MTEVIKTTCAYCGVGCGINAEVELDTREVKIQGDPEHPANYGKLCSKGTALGETLDLSSRLLEPEINGQTSKWADSIEHVATKFKDTIAKYGPESVAFYVSGQLLTEDYYVANKLIKGFIGSANIDTNSRLCMSSSVAGHKRAFGSDTVPNCYEDFELSDLVVLVGSNAAWCHPVLFQRIKKAKNANPNLKVVVIDPRKTDSCDIADLHIPLKIGSDIALFNGLLTYLYQEGALNQDFIDKHTEGFDDSILAAQKDTLDISRVAETCNVAPHIITTFFEWFRDTPNTLTLYSQGVNQSSSGTDKVNAILNCHLATGRIGLPGCGPFSLTGQPNAMGGREVGGLANQLAAHLEFTEEDISLLSDFWKSPNLITQPGLTAVDLFDAVSEGKIKALWVMATNPVTSLPNADKVKQAIKNCEFVVVSDCVSNTDTLDLAHVKLPAAGWSEKDGTVTNSERRISRQRALLPLAGQSKPDWWIICEVAKAMGYQEAFDYQSPAEIFKEHAALSAYHNNPEQRLRDFDLSGLSELSDEQYDALKPIQWPVNSSTPQGQKRLFANGDFFTASRKAQLVPVTYRSPVNTPSEAWPLALNTGRVRDQWHTMTRTALSARLNQHKSEPYLEISPEDAQKYNLKHGDIAEIESHWGSMLARVDSSTRVQEGEVFAPMHWTAQFSSQGRVGAVVNPETDPFSRQPESKHTPVSVKTFNAKWHAFLISRNTLRFDDIGYQVLIKGQAHYHYELAGNQEIEDWQAYLCNKLHYSAEDLDWQVYQDEQKEVYRVACFYENVLEAVLVVGPNFQLPERNWISSLFPKDGEPKTLDTDSRMALLTGKPPLGTPDVGKIICACFNVGEKTIQAAIKEHKLNNAQEVGKVCKAGTNCGSCVPEIKELF